MTTLANLQIRAIQPIADPQTLLIQSITECAFNLLRNCVRVQPGQVAIYALPRGDRLILFFDPRAIQGMELPPKYLQRLPEVLGGRRVLFSKRFFALQVSCDPQRPVELKSVALDLSHQSSPFHVPFGMTRRGEFWKSIVEIDSAIVGGARRMGKTVLLHAWIQSLIQGDRCWLILWDGKNNTEFGRYAAPNVFATTDLNAILVKVTEEVARREQLFRARGVTNLPAYNALPGITPLRPIVLVVDELADLPKEAEDALIQLVRRAGAYGVHPVVGIQRPDAEVMKGQLRANLTTRIALPVASLEDSRIILGRPGAQRLPKTKGRLLFVWDARLVEAQAFQVTLPEGQAVQAQSETPGLITERERRLVAAAVECDGWFRVREIAERARESRDWVNDVAQRWETVGFLTEIQRTPQGHTIGRRVTDSLLRAGGFGGQADSADSGGFGVDSTDSA